MVPGHDEQSGPLLGHRVSNQENTGVVYAMLEDSLNSSGEYSLASTKQSIKQPGPRLLGSRGPDSDFPPLAADVIGSAGASQTWPPGAKTLPAGLKVGDVASSMWKRDRGEPYSQLKETHHNPSPAPSTMEQTTSTRITNAPDSSADVHNIPLVEPNICSQHMRRRCRQQALPVPKYTKTHFHGEGKKFEVSTEHAVQVFVKANVLSILGLDDMDENFTATFTLDFTWIDPTLKGFKSKVGYYVRDGSLRQRYAAVIGYPGYDGAEVYTLAVDPRRDFAVGDTVEALKDICPSQTGIPRGDRGQITGLQNSRAWVCWNSNTTVISCSLDTIQIVPDENSKMIGKRGSDSELHIDVHVSRWYGILQPPDWTDPVRFQPRWSWLNAVEEPTKLVEFRQLQYISYLGGHVFAKYKFQGKFANKLKLEKFPFDRQELRIKISAEQHLEHLQWVDLDTIAGKSPSIPPEWDLEEKCGELNLKSPNEAYKGIFQQVYISIKLQRKPDFFLKQIVCPLFCLFLTSFLASLVEPSNIAERAAILLTVLLVMAGYRHMASQWVPRRSNNTRLDRYTLFAFFLQFVVVLWNFGLVVLGCKRIDDLDGTVDGKYNSAESGYPHRSPPEMECWKGQSKADFYFYLVIACFWVCLHFGIFIAYLRHHNCCCKNRKETSGGSSGGDSTGPKKHPYGILNDDNI
mmetsp:Transcript_2104/g.3687  ORF Transcript_2104/g.3687 Transcript_2104/m.3687 type:complete len:689 (-) Transcript_2104:97-2163(-)